MLAPWPIGDKRTCRSDLCNNAIATDKSLGLKAMWEFTAGRGGQEKTLAELCGEFALDVVPSKNYAANSAWKQLSILAHNLCRGFQIDTIAENKNRSRKRTFLYFLHSVRTLRFLFIAKAGRLTRTGGRASLRLSEDLPTQKLYENITLVLTT